MATGQSNKVIEQLRQAVLPRAEAGATDGQLLERFVVHRDAAAVEDLVRRHGPMVLGVCRRVLRHTQDAEDAFQATFLVLVRKAASVVPRELVANWLYGVAYQTARRAAVATARRRTREASVPVTPEPAAAEPENGNDLEPLLDLELSRLPDRYRVPIVLCELEGKTHREAAQQIGCPVGTLSGRLSRGRKLLARRLARHGLALSVGSLARVLPPQAGSATVPPALVATTVQTASLIARGQTAVAGAVPVNVAGLTEGVLKAMFITKLRLATGVLLAVVGLGAGVWVSGLVYRTQAAEPADAPKDGRPKGPTGVHAPAASPGRANRETPPVGVREVDERKLTRITTRVAGTVEKIYKATGDPVKKGEAVADLDSPDLTTVAQEFINAQGNSNLLQVTRERLRLLGADDDTIARMLRSGKPISRLTVRSPTDGVVVRTHRIKGDQVKAGDPLYDVADRAAPGPQEQPAPEPAAEPATVQELLKERLATLESLVKAAEAAYATGKASFAEVAQANALLVAAKLELCTSDKERLAVHERAVALARESERVATARYKAGHTHQAAVLAATANRLEAEIAYERAKARVTPAPK